MALLYIDPAKALVVKLAQQTNDLIDIVVGEIIVAQLSWSGQRLSLQVWNDNTKDPSYTAKMALDIANMPVKQVTRPLRLIREATSHDWLRAVLHLCATADGVVDTDDFIAALRRLIELAGDGVVPEAIEYDTQDCDLSDLAAHATLYAVE